MSAPCAKCNNKDNSSDFIELNHYDKPNTRFVVRKRSIAVVIEDPQDADGCYIVGLHPETKTHVMANYNCVKELLGCPVPERPNRWSVDWI